MSSTKSSVGWLMYPIVCVILGYLTISCKPDVKHQDHYDNPIEAAYFEDYESPDYKWGYINTQGEKIFKAHWDALKEMQPYLTAANFQGRWGYIDSQGREKINYAYKQATRFEDQRAFVQDFHNKWLLIDDLGTVLDTTDYTQVNSFQNGQCVVEKLGFKGVIDADGRIILPLEYKSIIILDENKFIARKANQYALVTSTETLTEFKYDKLYAPKDEIIRFKKDKSYGYLNLAGDPLSSKTYSKATNFDSGYAAVKSNGQYHLINKSLEIAISITADNLKSAGEGLWMFKREGKWGLIDSRGTIIMEPRYELMNRFSSGRIAVANDDLWGYCDDNGIEVIPLKYPLVWDFVDGRARFIYDRGVGFMDKSGKVVIADKFIEVRDFSNGKARFQSYR